MTTDLIRESVAPQDLKFDDAGLIPAIVQDNQTGEVLMLAYMNRESLKRTLETEQTWFFSRSRRELWNKGATSGNRQQVKWIRADCDRDTLLVGVDQTGAGACHLEGARDCFVNGVEGANSEHPGQGRILAHLARLIHERAEQRPEGSYTTTLFTGGVDRIGKKVGEEAVEVVIAAKNHALSPGPELAEETADLLYHLMVLLRAVDCPPSAVFEALSRRRR